MSINKILFLVALLPTLVWSQEETQMNKIGGGTFVPLYDSDSSGVTVSAFLLDVYPVTNQQYLDYVKAKPKWQRSKVVRLFADASYLIKWESDTVLGAAINPNAPATSVSWYAAKEYCACLENRLPTLNEWEYVAMASETKPNAQNDSIFNLKIIGSYETPKTYRKNVGSTYKNYWGIYDMHGLVWEWTQDFNTVMISGESRKDVDTDKDLFCGSASINATNLKDYAAFMRYAFRGSIEANYSILNLGFRCAKTIKK